MTQNDKQNHWTGWCLYDLLWNLRRLSCSFKCYRMTPKSANKLKGGNLTSWSSLNSIASSIFIELHFSQEEEARLLKATEEYDAPLPTPPHTPARPGGTGPLVKKNSRCSRWTLILFTAGLISQRTPTFLCLPLWPWYDICIFTLKMGSRLKYS